MPALSPILWITVLLWAMTTVTFLARVDKRKLSVLVFLFSLLMLIAVLHAQESFRPTEPRAWPVATPPVTGTF